MHPAPTSEIDYEKTHRLSKLIHLHDHDFGRTLGGQLHVVLEDLNVNDGYITGCLSDLESDMDYLGIAIAKLLLELSLDERIEAIEASRDMVLSWD